MKSFASITLLLLTLLLFTGCASNPLMTGEPADWKGRPSAELRVGLGEPTRIIPQTDGSEIWEYVSEGEFVREFRSPGRFMNVNRYLIRGGKVTKWFTERYENGQVVDRDH